MFDATLSNNTGSHSAEAHHVQLKAKTSPPVNITAAPLRRQSEVSQFSSSSNDGSSQACLHEGGGLDGHVPHMICKWLSAFPCYPDCATLTGRPEPHGFSHASTGAVQWLHGRTNSWGNTNSREILPRARDLRLTMALQINGQVVCSSTP